MQWNTWVNNKYRERKNIYIVYNKKKKD